MTSRATESTGKVLPGKAGGLLMGVGLGGFVDGIVLHQILQWHHMVSHKETTSTLAGLELNTLADGLFHILAWVCVLAGSIAMLRSWRQGRMSPNLPFHTGLLLMGWGLFNVADGIINHLILQIHHVRDDLGGPLSWDLGYLAVSAGLVVVGWLLYRRGLVRLIQLANRRER